MNFENLLGEQIFKKHNFDPLQSTSSLSIGSSFCICCLFMPVV